MASKEITGVIVSDKMDKSVVVAIERQIALYRMAIASKAKVMRRRA